VAQGRCEGCGYENASSKVMRHHQTGCSAYAELYRKDPALALDPEESFRIHREREHDPQHKAEERSIRLTKIFAENDEFRQRESSRWKSNDILA
jgi:hypothetical protein